MRRGTLAQAALIALIALCPTVARAKSEKTVGYTYAQVWSAAIRLIRVDRGYPVKDKDRDNGFILFVYPGTGAVKECGGSLEIFPIVDDEGFNKIQVKLSIAQQPSYIEVHLLDSLEQKLREELGAPPPPSKAKPEKKEEPKPQHKPEKKDYPRYGS